MITLLTTLAPLLLQVGLWAINLFVSNQAQRTANTQAFLNALSQHMNDALASAQERQNAWDQLQDLRSKAAARDAADGHKDDSSGAK